MRNKSHWWEIKWTANKDYFHVNNNNNIRTQRRTHANAKIPHQSKQTTGKAPLVIRPRLKRSIRAENLHMTYAASRQLRAHHTQSILTERTVHSFHCFRCHPYIQIGLVRCQSIYKQTFVLTPSSHKKYPNFKVKYFISTHLKKLTLSPSSKIGLIRCTHYLSSHNFIIFINSKYRLTKYSKQLIYDLSIFKTITCYTKHMYTMK